MAAKSIMFISKNINKSTTNYIYCIQLHLKQNILKIITIKMCLKIVNKIWFYKQMS